MNRINKILGHIKYLANTDYINDAQEMQDNLEAIHEFITKKLPEIDEFAYAEDIEKDNVSLDPRLFIYGERLAKEWRKHGYLIIGVDFDNTISPYPTLLNDADMDRAKSILLQCQEVGCHIVIHTATTSERYDHIRQYCDKIGLKISTINQTPEFLNIVFGKAGSKPYCNIFIDDRACLPHSLDLLEYALNKQREHVSVK